MSVDADRLSALGVDARRRAEAQVAIEIEGASGTLGRVVRQDRGRVVVATADDERSCSYPASIDSIPVVGDVVLISVEDTHVTRVFPRRQTLARRRAGTDVADAQVLCANVDLVVLVQPAAPLNLARIERGLSLAAESDAEALVVLSKGDLVENAPAVAGDVAARVGAEVLALSALEGEGVDPLRARIAAAGTAVLLGPSGAGKSTLLNALLGVEVEATQEVRAGDQKGRHTTVRRALYVLDRGGQLIDTPGTRELGLLGGDGEQPQGFRDIDALSSACRFVDCQHEDEPGCAVRAAVDDGALDPARLESYFRQRRELRHLREKTADTDHALRAREKRFASMVKDVKALKRQRRGR